MLLKSMQSQIKTIQPQIKTKRKKETKKIQVRRKDCFLKLHVLITIDNCTCKGLQGVPFVDLCVFLFLQGFLKESSCFEEDSSVEFVKVCLVDAFEKHAITSKNHSTTIKNKKEEVETNTGEKIQVRQKVFS